MSVEKEIIEDRIYIGNVDFKATEDDLKQFFEGLTVTEIDIPSKQLKLGKKVIDKHLGFAFVQFKDKEEANQAIEKYNGKEFKNRKIYVKKAVPPPTEEEKQKKNELFKAKKAEQAAKVEANKKAKRAAKNKAKKSQKAAAKAAATTNGETKPEGETTSTDDKEPTKKAEPKIPEGTPSTDTVFITNLDYKVDYKVLVGLFKEYKPKWIHVPTRKVPYHVLKRQRAKGRSIFNKGIAFVKLPNQETQSQVVKELNGKEINNRAIIVDIAVDARVPKDGEVEQANKETPESEEKSE